MADYSLDRLNVLVIDDNQHMRSLVKGILQALGVRNTRDAIDGAAALELLKEFPADLIICDWHMAPMDGLEFARLVRTDKESRDIYVPIIMVTGHTAISRVLEARDAGINEFLAKPISANKLYRRIKAIIDNPRAFIRIGAYFGPDRRRHQDSNYRGPDRRKTPVAPLEARSARPPDLKG